MAPSGSNNGEKNVTLVPSEGQMQPGLFQIRAGVEAVRQSTTSLPWGLPDNGAEPPLRMGALKQPPRTERQKTCAFTRRNYEGSEKAGFPPLSAVTIQSGLYAKASRRKTRRAEPAPSGRQIGLSKR